MYVRTVHHLIFSAIENTSAHSKEVNLRGLHCRCVDIKALREVTPSECRVSTDKAILIKLKA